MESRHHRSLRWFARIVILAVLLQATGGDSVAYSQDGQLAGSDAVGSRFADAEQAYDRDVLPLLQQYCFGCHAEGAEEGDFILDDHPSFALLHSDTQTWWAVLKNVRADVMPPDGEEQPSQAEKQLLLSWIMRYPFGAGSGQLDPGKTTLRRLNRLEYRNTIRDLMGVDFDTSVEFPPDDSGDGFDNNADALSISPLLAEKYVAAAAEIVDRAVPKTSRVIPIQTIDANDFQIGNGSKVRRLAFDKAVTATATFRLEHDAEYRVVVPIEIDGSFDFSAQRARVRVSLDGQVLHEDEYGWKNDFSKVVASDRMFSKGQHRIELELLPVEAQESKSKNDGTFVQIDLPAVRIEGPLEKSYWHKPDGYDRFFHLDDAPDDLAGRYEYAAEVLRRFCRRAYRRPVDESHLVGLLSIAGFRSQPTDENSDPVEGTAVAKPFTFEQQLGRAMTAVLASPRFLFRIERPRPGSTDRFPKIDDYSLASRLSYFLWSTMPDEGLAQLADDGALAANLSPQVERLLRDDRSSLLIQTFVGQWLQTRDVESVSIDPLAALGVREEYDELRDYLESVGARRSEPPADAPAEHHTAYKRYREIRELRGRLDGDVRRDMRLETERLFSYVIRENRSLNELVDSDYAFLNERLAKHYGLPAVKGDKLRKVDLPEESPLGGVLTQGTFLLVTSNPTRTSPVKRGLFILDNILGTPAPPAPALVPELEASAEQITIENPTLRQLLELHRSEALCRSCHARFDPLGLAFENFTAIGTWRDTENGQRIEPSGSLISGESFSSVSQLKQILVGSRRQDFYRCMAERMLSYAVGRSLDFRDEAALETIVNELEDHGGQAIKLIDGVISSAPFQRMRRTDTPTDP